jgi:hypothetical protein
MADEKNEETTEQAGAEEAAAEPEPKGAMRGGPVITDQLPCRIDRGDDRAQVDVLS